MSKSRLPIEAVAKLKDHKIINFKRWYRRPKVKDAVRRERIGGNVITLPPSAWKAA